MISLLADIFIIGSIAAFITGVIAIFLKQIRIRQKTRYYFLVSAFLFGAALTLGWQDFADGFARGLNDCRIDCCDSESEVESVSPDSLN